jgi:hypothetical protein
MAMLPYFHAGQWSEAEDPIQGGGDWERQLRAAGYAGVYALGNPEDYQWGITAYQRDAAPCWLVDIDSGMESIVVLAETRMDVLDLFTRYAPLVQASALHALAEALLDAPRNASLRVSIQR